MKIGFVAEPYEESHASGMGYVVLEFIKNIAEQANGDELVVYSSRPVNRNFLPGKYTNTLMPKGFVRQFFYFLRLKDDVDTLLFIAPLLPLWLPKRVKAVLVCQELASQNIKPKGLRDRTRSFLRDKILMPVCIARASKIIAASNSTKRDILRFYRVPEEKVQVIYDGFQDLGRFAESAPPIDASMQPYFFFAGKVKYRKNVHGIVAAFIALKQRRPSEIKLIIAGDYGGEYHAAMLQALEEAGFAQDVFFVGYVSSEKLYALYKHAAGFVFPSINEGFGMPPVEAMSLGVPVLTSKISSMAEVAGDAALLVDPFNVAEISDAMEKILFDDAVRADLIGKGYERAKKFSWPLAASECLTLLRNL
jgi:glycosyltransferase involved in cell wall biosynthesis